MSQPLPKLPEGLENIFGQNQDVAKSFLNTIVSQATDVAKQIQTKITQNIATGNTMTGGNHWMPPNWFHPEFVGNYSPEPTPELPAPAEGFLTAALPFDMPGGAAKKSRSSLVGPEMRKMLKAEIHKQVDAMAKKENMNAKDKAKLVSSATKIGMFAAEQVLKRAMYLAKRSPGVTHVRAALRDMKK